MKSSFSARVIALLSASLLFVSCGPSASDQAPPELATPSIAPAAIGECIETTVSLVGPRLEGAPESGSSIQYANGMSQVSYDVLAGVTNSSVGDAVRLCLVSIPEDCPPGDDRGRVYSGTNLRTNETWTAPDSPMSA